VGSTQVPEGYKQTEIGMIPEDWELTIIRELKPYVTSGSRGWARYYAKFGAPFIRITNLLRSSIYLDPLDLKNVRLPIGVSEGKRTELKNGDILVSITADIGIVGYVDDSISKPSYINQHIALVRFEPKIVDSKFIAYFLSSENVQHLFQGATDQGAKAGLNLDTIRNLKLAVPPLPEQRSIAQALSDVDALIAALDKLIAKKCHLKTATMQQLLTGKMRLAGFNERWSSYTILEICKNIIDYRGRTPKKLGMEWGNGDIPALSANNVKMGFIDFRAESYFASNNLYQKWMQSGNPRKGDIVLTMEAPLGNVALIPDERKYILSQRVILLQTHETHIYNDFLLQMMMSEKFHFLLSQDSSGTTATGIQRKKLEKISLLLPQLDEQIAIAQVLSDMDAEITALENRRAKNQAIKQGMMQELLTGRTRLV
jgi:type I restriction enzyme, S subunit